MTTPIKSGILSLKIRQWDSHYSSRSWALAIVVTASDIFRKRPKRPISVLYIFIGCDFVTLPAHPGILLLHVRQADVVVQSGFLAYVAYNFMDARLR